jgi:23S rRNA pseudouridine1911/1915/1917 synthase
VARDLCAVATPDAPLTVLLETASLVVVDKPAGQPSAPLEPDEQGTLANALLGRYPEMATIGYSRREPGLCHRLDNDTSGLLVAARTPEAFATITQAIRAGELHKRYLLVCDGAGLAERGTIELPLAPHPRDARRVLACSHPRDEARLRPRPAVTAYKVLERAAGGALVEVRAACALRHQIRAHFAAIGHPIHGDRLYGSTVARELGRHALHASLVAWAGGSGVPEFRVRSALPPELRALLAPSTDE